MDPLLALRDIAFQLERAHAPGQLDWQDGGCARAEKFGISPDRVINTRSADDVTSRAGH